MSNEPEDKRRAKRLAKEKQGVEKIGKRLPQLHESLTRVTQTSVKFLRWLLYRLWRPTSREAALSRLRRAYASLSLGDLDTVPSTSVHCGSSRRIEPDPKNSALDLP